MSSPGCIRHHNEVSSSVALDASMMRRTQPKAQRRGEMPQSLVRRADAFDGAGKPLTTSLDAGVPLRDVQEAASYADPRTTMRYDRARVSLDRHATYIVAAYIAGAAR